MFDLLESFFGTGLGTGQPLGKFGVFIQAGHINLILGEAFTFLKSTP